MRKIFLVLVCALLLLPASLAGAEPATAAPAEAVPAAGMEARLKLLEGDWLSPKGTLILEIQGQKINGCEITKYEDLVDRSTMGSTYVRKGVKLDNLVQIAHNNDIGENTVMSAQVGIAGSTKVGQWCMFGGQVGIAGHITIGDKVFLGAQSGVPGSLKSNQQLIGTPPMEQRPYFKSQAIFQRLPEMYKQLNALQKEIEELKKNK